MITKPNGVYLELRGGPAPEASAALERDGYTLLPGTFSPEEVKALRTEIEAVYDAIPADTRNSRLDAEHREDFRYEMLNRSAACQRAVGDRRLLDGIEPLLGEDCHVIANTAWRNPPREEHRHGGGNWHIDAGPHVPRPPGVPWDDRIPYPVFAVAVHLYLMDCPLEFVGKTLGNSTGEEILRNAELLGREAAYCGRMSKMLKALDPKALELLKTLEA